ncbi:MAG: alpha/beta hydrolase [Candidatus Nanopelagicales bacterium]|nr:alpha/beta hydrolase [Candidatus Nanopelagicales bacterium]MCU0294646.1 alpha/beta hydrolase [Candidatus Nanopelagicales bacterium]MCU0297147.1 alpha/beta hydrolase [Candidatus Nanopelagicales bacterium]
MTTEAAAVRQRVPGRQARIDGNDIFLREIGTGAPALFVHGLGGNSTNWTDLMWMLSDRLDCVAPDLPGFGRSGPAASGSYTPESQADVLADYVASRFTEPIHLFGNSMGGAISVQLAGRHPDLIRSMTLVSPAMPDLVPMRTNVQLPVIALPGVGEKLATRIAQLPVEKRVQATLNLVYADPSCVPPQRVAEAQEDVRELAKQPWVGQAFQSALRGILASYFDRGPDAPWKLAERVKVPVLLIYGQQDKLVNPRSARRASKHFLHSRVMILPHSGHVSQMEHPEMVERAWRHLIEPYA